MLGLLVVLLLFVFGGCVEGELENGLEIPPLPRVVIVDFEEASVPLLDEPASSELDMPLFNEYIISLDFEPESRRISGIESVRYTNRTGANLDSLVFRVPLGGDVMEISHVFQDNDELSFSVVDTVLDIRLLREIEPGETVLIHIHFEAAVPLGNQRSGANDYAVWGGAFLPVEAVFGQRGWHDEPFYPMSGPFILDVVNHSVEITTPLGYAVAGTGTKFETYMDDHKVTTFTAQLTRDFAFAISPYFQRNSIFSPSGQVEISLYHYSADLPVDHILGVAADTLTFFEDVVGMYPFSHLCIVETDMFVDAVNFSTLIFADSESLHSCSELNGLRKGIARQWFSVTIGNNPIEEAWLSGGLALFLGLLEQPGDISAAITAEHRYLRTRLPHVQEELRRLNTGVDRYENFEDYILVQRRKAQLMFYALYREMGAENFKYLLREYYRQFAFQNATAADFIELAEDIHGQSLLEFFDHWLNTSELPDLPAR